MKKRLLSLMLCMCMIFSIVGVQIEVKAAPFAPVVAGGVLAGSGVALLALLALSGVGMELENKQNFENLSDSEKERIQSGLVQNFEDVALQKGYALSEITNWLDELKSGILDKASGLYETFKEWALDGISLKKDNSSFIVNGTVDIEFIKGTYSSNVGTVTIGDDIVDAIKNSDWYQSGNWEERTSAIIVRRPISSADGNLVRIGFISKESVSPYGDNTTVVYTDNIRPSRSVNSNVSLLIGYNLSNIASSISAEPLIIGGSDFTNYSELSEFRTNTDYLERLKGKEEPIEVIDVTDIKNPIVETKPNSIARIDYNRGTNNKGNNDDDNKKGYLVPADVWYQSLDDYIEEQNNAVVEYDNSISENPQDSDKIFISTAPVINYHNYFNTLPTVNFPQPLTIVNNNYEYNNYNNNNVTVYQYPYGASIIPNLPLMIFENKFPFCIPWDIYNFLSIFYVEKEAPRIDVPFPIKGLSMETETITIDLAPYNYLSDVLRVMFFVLFIVGLAFVTRYLIKG